MPVLERLNTPTRYSADELDELRRSALCLARALPRGNERNQHRQIASSLRALFRSAPWLSRHGLMPPRNGVAHRITGTRFPDHGDIGD